MNAPAHRAIETISSATNWIGVARSLGARFSERAAQIQTERPRENALQAATTYAGSIVNQPLRNRGTVCDDGLSHQITRAEQPAGFSRSRMPI